MVSQNVNVNKPCVDQSRIQFGIFRTSRQSHGHEASDHLDHLFLGNMELLVYPVLTAQCSLSSNIIPEISCVIGSAP